MRSLLIMLPVFLAAHLFSMEQLCPRDGAMITQAPKPEQAMIMETDEDGNNVIRFTTPSALKHFLNKKMEAQAPEFCAAFLEKLPGNSFSPDELTKFIKALGEKIYAERIASEKNPLLHFMLTLKTIKEAQIFLHIFLENKNE